MEYEAFLKDYQLTVEEEKKPLLSIHTHCLVWGIAGSGKTNLLNLRSAYQIQVEGMDADQIWNIATDAASAKRMAREFRHQFPETALPHYMDLYALAYKIIKMDHEAKEQEVWPAYRNLKSFVETIGKEMFGVALTAQKTAELMQKISYCKNMMLPDSKLEDIKVEGIPFGPFYRMYEKNRKAKSFYDMDDVLIEALHILQADRDVLEGCHQAITLLQVDDMQEVSFAGHMLLRLLCAQHASLFAVADKMQCHSLRCAFPEALDTLASVYTGLETFTLTKNYRNAKFIGEIASQFSKSTLDCVSELEGDVKFKGFSTMDRMYTYAMELIQAEPNKEHAFLYRNEVMVLPFLDLLKQNQIPFACAKSVRNILKQPILQDVLCFIRLMHDPRDLEAFLRVQEYFHLDIPQRVLQEVSDRVSINGMDIYQALNDSSLRAASKKKLAGKMEKIRLAGMKNTNGMIAFILKEMAYRNVLDKLNTSEKDPVMLVMYTMAERYEQPEEFIAHMMQLSEFGIMELANVKLVSVQESKGNEYDCVYLIDCMNTLFPKTSVNDPIERSLFYTAITRAISHLEFFTFKKAFAQKVDVSPFVFEIYGQKQDPAVQGEEAAQPKRTRLADLKRGKKILHATLGEGKILKIADGMLHVQFANETKTLNAKLCLQNELITLA